MRGVTMKLPNFKGASAIMLMCTGKKAISMSIMPYTAQSLVCGNISNKANNISNTPASILMATGYGK